MCYYQTCWSPGEFVFNCSVSFSDDDTLSTFLPTRHGRRAAAQNQDESLDRKSTVVTGHGVLCTDVCSVLVSVYSCRNLTFPEEHRTSKPVGFERSILWCSSGFLSVNSNMSCCHRSEPCRQERYEVCLELYRYTWHQHLVFSTSPNVALSTPWQHKEVTVVYLYVSLDGLTNLKLSPLMRQWIPGALVVC